MNKEELKKEAENWLRKYLLCCNCEKKCNCIDSNSYCEEQVLQAYVDSAEPREKRIAELEAQIEKMKCCGNCEHFNFNEPNYCHKGVYRERQYVCSEWEFGN